MIRVFDIETSDPLLLNGGTSFYKGQGFIIGCGIKDFDDEGKEVRAEWITLYSQGKPVLNYTENKERLRHLLGEECDKLTANGKYDIDWLENWADIKVNGFIHDVLLAFPLLDAYRMRYSLSDLCSWLGIPGKSEDEIRELAQQINPKAKSPQQLLHLMPSDIVGKYCLGDLDATYHAWVVLMKRIKAEELTTVYELECNLVRPLVNMRKNGVQIDQKRLDASYDIISEKESALLLDLYEMAGVPSFAITNNNQIGAILKNTFGLDLPLTKTGKLCTNAEVLETFGEHPFVHSLQRCKKLNKLRTTFIESAIKGSICPDGRVHGEFNQLKNTEGGTVTGRFSGKNPNLQQIPRNDKELGSLIRGCFTGFGNDWYGKTDYSQIEYRLFFHYARGYRRGDTADIAAEEGRALFNAHPETDYHQYVIDLIKQYTGMDVDRPTAKRINFGALYFMGVNALSRTFGIPYDDAERLYGALFRAVPFIEPTRQYIVDVAERRGYTKTILGRRQRISPMHVCKGKVLTFEDGTSVKGILDGRRDKTYPLFNYTVQGSAADAMKKGMMDCWNAGVYKTLSLMLTVHDETGVSVPKSAEGIDAYEAQAELLSNVFKLRIPLLAEAEYGANWGEVKGGKDGLDVFDTMRAEIGIKPKNNIVRSVV